jgi:hypothetical protein
MKTSLLHCAALILPLTLAGAKYSGAQQDTAPTPEPTRIVIEAEDMTGVNQNEFGFGPTWRVGRWGTDLYQNMNFGGVWASRLRTAMTDATSTPASAYSDITVPAAGTYKLWAKYEAPPFFNYAFGIKVQELDGAKRTVFQKTYGLLDSPKHFSFNDKLVRGSLYWDWGLDHDAAEGYEAKLAKGRYRVTLAKTANPQPAGGRSVDAILITSDLSELSAPHLPRYPLLDELRRANHVYFRFRNLSDQPVRIEWNHWNHRYPDFYAPSYRELVKFYDASGKEVVPEGGNEKAKGNWPQPLEAGASSVWYDLGPTMNVESTSPFTVRAVAATGSTSVNAPTLPVGVDIALAPDAKKIVKSFQTENGEPVLAFLVQPDLDRPDGVAYTKKNTDIYRDVARQLNATPRLGPIPKKIKIFGGTGTPFNSHDTGQDLELAQEFRHALGINTVEPNIFDRAYLDAIAKWWQPRGGIIERSMSYQHSQDIPGAVKKVNDSNVLPYFYFLSYGDEIGLPNVNTDDPAILEEFRGYVKASGETPQSLGLGNWEQVKPLNTLSADVAVKIGVLPEKPAGENPASKLKRLYWYSTQFRIHQGIEDFAAKTKALKAALGNEVESSANLGGMHPFFWMHQSSFIEAFKHNAMSLAWSEDYTYSQPEATRLVADFEASYLRKGTSYHDQRMQYYCMPHWPGNDPEILMQNAVMQWANNVKDLDWFNIGPDIWGTENYVAYRGGLPMWKTARTISGMAGLIEDDLLPARPVSTPVAMLLSESSDVWEVEGSSQGAVRPAENGKPATVASNISQEERKNLWYALRNAGYRVDFVTEDDVKEGLLDKYKVLYVCGQNLQRAAADKVKQWVQSGRVLYATAGAARKDEFDEPLTTLDEVLGRGAQKSYERFRGPLRAKLELLFLKPLDTLKIGDSTLDVLASKEEFVAAPGAQVLATYASDNSPAWVKNSFGKGMAFYTGALPGEAFVQKALPVVPAGKGGPESSSSHFEPVDFNATARAMILRPLQDAKIAPDTSTPQRGVVMGRLSSPHSTVVPIVNLIEQHDGTVKNLPITLTAIAKKPSKVWSCFHKDGVPFTYNNGTLTLTLPTLQVADVIVISNG